MSRLSSKSKTLTKRRRNPYPQLRLPRTGLLCATPKSTRFIRDTS